MTKNRLEGFSDGVLAVIMTIMVLEMKAPRGADLAALLPVLPVLAMANLYLLFWLSLVPFATGWMGENDFAPLPVALYGLLQLVAGFAFFLLVQALIRTHGRDSALATVIGRESALERSC